MALNKEYVEYCRCWSVYLQRISDPKDRAFRRGMEDSLPPGSRVLRWPEVWPETCYLFSPGMEYDAEAGRSAFVAAVQHAEREPAPNPHPYLPR